MPEPVFDLVHAYIAELRDRAAKAQTDARDRLNPIFAGDDSKPPRDFIESSFLYMRSCDIDSGSRPFPCPVFWLSPDLRVAPLSDLGTPTRELKAGGIYRLTATVRNRGDLIVPSAKVEFWLVTPSLGFDTRFAAKIGVAAGRVMPYSATEVHLDYSVPPSISGHRCLFARVFSFAPLDIPVDDFALNPVIDRHVAQQNLDIVAQGSSFALDWFHHRNARERFEIVAMDQATIRAIRREEMGPLILTSRPRGGLAEITGQIGIDFGGPDAEGVRVEIGRTEAGLELFSSDQDAVSIGRQAELTKEVQAAIAAMEGGKPLGSQARELFAEYRAMTAQIVRSRVHLSLPNLGLKPDRGLALHLVRRDMATGAVAGGVGLVVVGE